MRRLQVSTARAGASPRSALAAVAQPHSPALALSSRRQQRAFAAQATAPSSSKAAVFHGGSGEEFSAAGDGRVGRVRADAVEDDPYWSDGAGARDPFHGIAREAFSKELCEALARKVDPSDVEIRPDGHLFLPEVKYRRLLNSTFGPGAWALMPRGAVSLEGNYVTREYALFIHGRFISQARGEHLVKAASTVGDSGAQQSSGPNFSQGPGTMEESVKSNALMRCCKDLGIASDLWDHDYLREWKSRNAVLVTVENMRDRSRRKFWRRRDHQSHAFSYPWREVSDDNLPTAADSASTSHAAAPASSAAAASNANASRVASGGVASGSGSAVSGTGGRRSYALDDVINFGKFKESGRRWKDLKSKEELDWLQWLVNNAKVPAQQEIAKKALDAAKAMKELGEESGDERPL